MLYMVELRHSPDRCPRIASDVRELSLGMYRDRHEVLQAHGCTWQGGWGCLSGHVTFLLLDAPGAHAVDGAIIDLNMTAWNTTTIYPVLDFDAAMETVENANIGSP